MFGRLESSFTKIVALFLFFSGRVASTGRTNRPLRPGYNLPEFPPGATPVR